MKEIYNPPYTITNQILNSIAVISDKVSKIETYKYLDSKPHLRRENRIRSIYSSCKIEANSLKLDEVRDVINGKKVIGPKKEIQEVLNAYRTYELIDELNPYKITNLKKAHKELTSGLILESGNFRKGEEGVFDGDTCIFMAPPAKRVPELMDNLFEWMNNNTNSIHPLILSSIFHFEFVFIHPFTDGNGRLARFWQTLILSKWKDIFKYIPIESSIESFQEDYYKAITKSEKDGNSTFFIEFMLSRINDILDEVLKQNKNYDNDYVNKLLSVMNKSEYYSAIELMNILNLKSRNNFRDLYLKPALKIKAIIMKYPKSPTSKNQKYKRNNNKHLSNISNLDSNYADMILQDLLKQGYKGEKLKKELEKRKELVKKNIKRLIKEIDESRKKDKLYTYKDVFGEDPK